MSTGKDTIEQAIPNPYLRGGAQTGDG